MSLDRNKSRPWQVHWICGLVFMVLATEMSHASCVSELSRIVRAARGFVTGRQGEAIQDAQITVSSSSGEKVFQTKSTRDGSFYLGISPGKYRVKVEADGYLRLEYVVDLRSHVSEEPTDIFLQRAQECRDVHLTTGQNSEEPNCSSEVLPPNLVLRQATKLSGEVKDETGAPFKNSEVVLRKLSDAALQPGYLISKTDEGGAFTLDEAEPGPYRLLASPSRAFAQPTKLDCYEMQNCKLEITLSANGTDLPYASCPVR